MRTSTRQQSTFTPMFATAMVFTREDMATLTYKGSSFSRSEEEYLMDRWEENPILWDIHNPDFKNYSVKDAAKEEIANRMNRSVTDIKMKMKYLNDQYTRARRKVLTCPETANLSRRDEHLLRRLSFLQESKASSCPGFVTEVKDAEDTDGREGAIVVSSVTLEDPSVIGPADGNESEDSETMQNPKNAIVNKVDPDSSPGGQRHQAAGETDNDIKDVIINLHQTTATVATVSSTSTSSKPSPVLLTALNANKTTRSSHALQATSNSNSNQPPALPSSTSYTGEPKLKKRKCSEQHEVQVGAARNIGNSNINKSIAEEKKSEAYFFGQFVIEALKTMSPDTRSWCQMEISKIIYQARSAGWKSSTNNGTSH